VLVGECVHDIRCALDHLAWALAEQGIQRRRGRVVPKEPHRGTAFPVCANPEKFFERRKADPTNPKAFRPYTYDSGMNKIIQTRPEAQAYIERCQPYHGDRNTLLLLLNDLENRDKHRKLNLTFMIPNYWGHADPPGVEIKVLRYALQHGTPFAHVTYPPGNTEVDVNLYVAADVGFILNTGGTIEATELLTQLWWHVQSVLRGALPLFGTSEPDIYTTERVERDRRYWEILQEPPRTAV